METTFKLAIGQKVGNMKVTELHVVQSGNETKNHYELKCNNCTMIVTRTEEYLLANEGAVTHKCTSEIRARHFHFYSCWSNAWNRIMKPSDKDYPNYGGRGLELDYDDIESFYKDHIESYLEHVQIHGEKDTTLDRIDGGKGYVKGNLRWATREVQANNTCATTYFLAISPNGRAYVEKGVCRFARQHGLHPNAIYDVWRCKGYGQGWTFKRTDKEEYERGQQIKQNLLNRLNDFGIELLCKLIKIDFIDNTDMDDLFEYIVSRILKEDLLKIRV
jgi:hypothetical protein